MYGILLKKWLKISGTGAAFVFGIRRNDVLLVRRMQIVGGEENVFWGNYSQWFLGNSE